MIIVHLRTLLNIITTISFALPSLIHVLQQSHQLLEQQDQTTQPTFPLYFCLSEIPVFLTQVIHIIIDNIYFNLHFHDICKLFLI